MLKIISVTSLLLGYFVVFAFVVDVVDIAHSTKDVSILADGCLYLIRCWMLESTVVGTNKLCTARLQPGPVKHDLQVLAASAKSVATKQA
jgi:hypothetical protein